ncbi:MAG TPA: L,D-transpeptidase family protein [Thermomicrobiaceae bacterium]|nr:L,D-transpeptidase family protein [Thermomicrobiaceae bacterium]
MVQGRRAVLLGLILVLAAGWAAPGQVAAADFTTATIYFSETGHHLSGDFLKTWQANGGLMTFGYPISEPLQQDGMTVQYFERARLEEHPEHTGTPYVVEATLLGNWVAQTRRSEAPFKPLPANTGAGGDSGRRFFPETGHSLAYGFLKYWQENGGLYVFGYPISEEFSEKNPDTGQVYTVQYFERARFEYHPENQGTQFEVLLGRLGAQYATARDVTTSAVKQQDGSVTAFAGLLDPRWSKALRTEDGFAVGIVTADSLNIRSAPQLDAGVVGTTYKRHPVEIQDIVDGDSVNGVTVWYKIGDGQYIAAGWVEPFVPDKPPATYSGHWVDVSLSNFYAVAYDGERPVYAAIITAGRDGKTPTGVYQIFSRVEDETMDSATVGIPKGAPGYYYLEHVMYTQYFKADGYAVHGNWWTDPSNYGGFTSNGCVGLQNSDALWFWNFLSIGSTVQIHT